MKKGTKRKIGAAIIGLTFVTGATIGTVKLIKNYLNSPGKYLKDLTKSGAYISETYQIGTYNYEGENSEFSYINAGTYTHRIDDKDIKILEDRTVPTGIIIQANAKNYAEMYFTIDYIKDLVKNYNIEENICINIDDMVASSKVPIDEVYMMVYACVDKLEANSCKVKIVGHETCVKSIIKEKERAEQAGEFNKRDIGFGVVLDYVGQKLDREYDLIISDNYIYSDKDYKQEISGKYNDPSLFFDDYVYKARFDTNVQHISEETGLSVSNIKRYNFMSSDEVLQGRVVYIPSVYHAPYWKGVDISSYQGDIDFDKFEQVDFAIVRASYTSKDDHEIYSDSYVNHYLNELNNRKIPTGAYFLTRANDNDEFIQEVKTFFRQIEGHDISLPVYIDIENDVEINQEHIRIFLNLADDLGYKPGIYINKSRYERVMEYAGTYPIWVSGGYAYDEEQKYEDMYILNKLEYGVNIFQTCQYGSGEELGIPYDVDYDYADCFFMEEMTKDKDVKIKVKE